MAGDGEKHTENVFIPQQPVCGVEILFEINVELTSPWQENLPSVQRRS
jgi:hypothetical protein